MAPIVTGSEKMAAPWARISKFSHSHSSHPGFRLIFPKLQSKEGLRKIRENPQKPSEVHICPTITVYYLEYLKKKSEVV